MAPNLFTFNPFVGMSPGIVLDRTVVSGRTGRLVPPQITCGSSFIGIDNRWQHPPLTADGRLYEAAVTVIEPHGKKPFPVLTPRHVGSSQVYCLVDTTLPPRVTLRQSPAVVRARFGLEISAGVETLLADASTQQYFLAFTTPDAEVEVWYASGYLSCLRRQGEQVVSVMLSPDEMVARRIAQSDDELQGLVGSTVTDQKRRHGVVAGMIRLLSVFKDRAAVDLLADFLREYRADCTTRMCQNIEAALRPQHHPLVSYFRTDLVVTGQPTLEAPQKVRTRDRKARKAAFDAVHRQLMRGPTTVKSHVPWQK